MRSCRSLLAHLLLSIAFPAAAELPAEVIAALQRAGIGADALAVAAVPLQHAAPPWLHRARVAMQPGSAMKVVTTIVALDRLGPGHRGFTELRSAAPLAGGVLQGDLVLRGGADPELGIAQFWALLLDLRQAGVRRIDGDLIVDRSRFHPARPDLGVPPFDEAPEFAYNGIPDALQLAGNLLPLQFDSDGERVRAATVPPLPGLELVSRMTLNDRACKDWDDDWQPARVTHAGTTTTIELNGAFPRHCSQRTALQLIDRLELAERLMRALWQGLGGEWGGRAREAPAALPDSRLLARRDSRPWGELIRTMNKQSDNVLSRLLFLELGVGANAALPPGNTAARSAAVVRDWFTQHAIDARGLVLDNGSGLSRSERITPLQLASMLAVAWHGRHASELTMSLPQAGVDGTMRNRLKDSPARGWARLKTGTLRDAVALAGYVSDAQGRPWALALMVNDDGAGRARPVLDALVDHIARHGLPGAPRVVGPQGEGP